MLTENNQAPRVLFVATTKSAGGIERYSIRLAMLLRARGVAVTYACRPGSFLAALCAERGIPVASWSVRNIGVLASAFSLQRIIQATESSLIHIHSRRDYVPAILGARLAEQTCVLLHAHMIRSLGKPSRLAGHFFHWGANQVIAVSSAVRQNLFRVHRFPSSFVSLLPNGVDVAAFENANGAHQRQDWGIPTDALVVGMVGRLNAKGQSTLLTVAPQLLAQIPNIWFVFVGPDGLLGDRERLCAQAAYYLARCHGRCPLGDGGL
jgi:glycosyltransferase involved in cell wall biosynthesis